MKKLNIREAIAKRKAQKTSESSSNVRKKLVIKRATKKTEEVEEVNPKAKKAKNTKAKPKPKDKKYGKFETLEEVCENCSACKGKIESPKLPPIGSKEETEVYFVKSSIRLEEDEMGVIAEEDSGNFIKGALLAAEFKKGTIRIGSAVRCISKLGMENIKHLTILM